MNEFIGGMVYEDDLAAGQYVCVHSMKHRPKAAAAIMGQSLLVKAVCLPYFVGQMLSDPSQPTFTFDARFVKLMRVSPEFVQAQKEGCKTP